MIIVKLQGGLGNQMFQYAAARSIANGSTVILDGYFLKHHTKSSGTFTSRNLELTAFKQIKAKVASDVFANLLNGRAGVKKYVKKLLFKYIKYTGHFTESEFMDLSGLKGRNIYLEGYFQDERYFKHIRQEILRDFTFAPVSAENRVIEQKIKAAATPVSIHIRRGDFLKPALLVFNGLLPLSYYRQAMEIIKPGTANQQYFIFSDDPEWCKESFQFLGDRAVIASGGPAADWEDMYLMSLCHHNIVANSSYSWWGAWLNNHPQKTVIAPEKWFYDMDTNIIPKQWIKLPVSFQ